MNPRKNHAHGINLAVAQELTEARRAAGYTNEELAAAMPGVSLTSVQRYLAGRSAIDIEVLSRICNILEVSETDVVRAAEQRAKQWREQDDILLRRVRAEAEAQGVSLSLSSEVDAVAALRKVEDGAGHDDSSARSDDTA